MKNQTLILKTHVDILSIEQGQLNLHLIVIPLIETSDSNYPFK